MVLKNNDSELLQTISMNSYILACVYMANLLFTEKRSREYLSCKSKLRKTLRYDEVFRNHTCIGIWDG